jgi:cardiolipin synthase C
MKAFVLLSIMLAVVLAGANRAFHPPPLEGRTASQAVEAQIATQLGRVALSPPQQRGGDSGVVPLVAGPNAFAARIVLIRAAEVALDVQYYIWERDTVGLILLDELRAASERGVRVRLLRDDNGITGLDRDLAALDALANVEVRLFNPFILRRPKVLGYLFDFFRLNRRMHNKALSADGAMSILGGRNIGNIYFGFGEGVQFIDTDVLVAGKAAADVGADFDRYWSSRSAHPVERILPEPDGDGLGRLAADAAAAASSAEGRIYAARLRQSNIVTEIASGALAFEWTNVTLVSDDPAKGIGEAAVSDLLFPQLMELLSRPARSVDLVSAYFVPGRRFSAALANLARSGIEVRVLTNSLDATDIIVVHSAYVKYRASLLRAGVELYELKPAYALDPEKERAGIVGSSRVSLHSKTMAVDEASIFIGSFNFDPRSFALNTEMGVLIESPRLATRLARAFDAVFPGASYRPAQRDDGTLIWEETTADGDVVRHDDEPDATLSSRLLLSLLGLLPIEWLL